MERRKTRQIQLGNVKIGGGAPVAVQSMTNTHTDDAAATLAQINRLTEAGCDIVRCAVPDMAAAEGLKEIVRKSPIPVIADIHFDYRLALEAVAAGIDKIRINPGNIGGMDRVRQVVAACQSKQIPIRIGVNSGSLEKDLLAKYGAPTAEALVESVMRHVKMLEDCDFTDIVISMKSSTVSTMIDAYRLAAQQCAYPLHLGVTEAGTAHMGLIKSAIGIGALLHDGIGATIRVSLTDDPIQEIAAAKDILKCMGLRGGPELVACPTCGRTRIDLVQTAKEVEAALANVDKDIKVAVMGCVVNGPGEAREADIGIAGGKGEGLLIKKGEVIRKVPEDQLLLALQQELDRM